MNEAFLLTGSNMGYRQLYLQEAARNINLSCGSIVRFSSLYETEAWGKQDQPPFLNQVLVVHTLLPPKELLHSILHIEEDMGRKRLEKFGPRIIDIDIIFYNNLVTDQPGLHLPHPRMQDRRFVLEPLAELAPGKLHPVFLKPVHQLLAECTDPLAVYKIN